jgi:hypothetical protein
MSGVIAVAHVMAILVDLLIYVSAEDVSFGDMGICER